MKRLVIALLLAAPASAQVGTSALRNLDSRAPIDVNAQRIEVLDAQNQAIFTGGVTVKQAQLNLAADRIKVSYVRGAGGGDPVIKRLDAQGGVRLVTPTERATGRFGIYDIDARTLTMVGDVVLNQGSNVLRGNRLAIDLRSGRSALSGGTAANGGRVSGRFAVSGAR
jgi:lipopolysaccharide export system protein LptA